VEKEVWSPAFLSLFFLSIADVQNFNKAKKFQTRMRVQLNRNCLVLYIFKKIKYTFNFISDSSRY